MVDTGDYESEFVSQITRSTRSRVSPGCSNTATPGGRGDRQDRCAARLRTGRTRSSRAGPRAKAHERLVVEQSLANFMGLDEWARVYRRANILRAQPILLLERRDLLLQISEESTLERIVVKLLKKFRGQVFGFCACGRVSNECHQEAPGSACNVWCLVAFDRKHRAARLGPRITA